LGIRCNRRPICVGIRLALCRDVEPHDSQETPAPATTSNDAETRPTPDPAAAPATPQAAAGGSERPAMNWSLILVGIVGLCLGSVIVFAFGQVSADEPPDVAPAVAAPAPPAPEIESTPPPTWTGSQRATWAHDGSKTIAFTLAATRDLPVWMAHARPALVVRCQYRATEAFVVLDTSASFEDDADRRTVQIQWDDDESSTQRWGVSETGRELFAPDGKEFVRRAATARTLRFGFTPFNASPVTAVFAVKGFDELAGVVATTCGWRV
jgi:hypothetical protein